MNNGEFDSAEQLLLDLEFETEEERKENILQIKAMHAHHLFSNDRKYKMAIDILRSINASPNDVINLFPEFNTSENTDEPIKSG